MVRVGSLGGEFAETVRWRGGLKGMDAQGTLKCNVFAICADDWISRPRFAGWARSLGGGHGRD
jgi:hypothetical protein